MKNLINTRILLSGATILAASAVIIGATFAFFSDTETSQGNTLAAGAIDLTIDNTSYVTGPDGTLISSPANSWDLNDLTNQLFFSFNDIKPGDIGEDTISIHVNDNDAWVCAAARVTEDSDATYTEPELEDDSTVNEGDPEGTDGELAENLNFAFWADDGDNVLETDEVNSIFVSGPASNLSGNGAIVALADSANNIWTGLASDPLNGESTAFVGKAWCFGTLTPNAVAEGEGTPLARGTGFTCSGAGDQNNAAQTDRVVGDFQFYAEQSRNNANFTCEENYAPAWNDGEDQLVGAALASYAAPTCDTTVSGTQSVQAAVNDAAIDSTVCVDGSYDGTGDNTAIRIEVSGLTLAATVRGVDLDVPVVLSNSDVTVTGFDGTIGQAESPAEQAAFYLDNDADGAEISFNRVTGGAGAAILTETGAALGGTSILNNVLSGATQGIYLNPHAGTITIQYNDIDNNVAGIAGLNGATVQYNEFEHTTPGSEAIGADSTYDANPATVSFNNFLNGTMLNTYIAITGDVSAENNFWGPNGGAAQTGGTDEVDYTPEAGSQYPHQ